MDKTNRKTDSKGFTLIELMVVMAIAALTLFLAAPAMRVMIDSNQLRTQASLLMSALQLARSEAIIRNTPVSLCPSQAAIVSSPQCSGSYADGWIIFANPDRDRVVDADSDEVISVHEGLPEGYTLTNRTATQAASEIITYLTDGSSRKNRTLMLCPAPGSSAASWSVVINRVGRARMARAWGDCPRR
ncbi:MAG: GspH/FimT family pseudopilin [Halioglobus sp.]